MATTYQLLNVTSEEKTKKVKNKNKHTCKKKNEATKGLCNNYLEGAGRVGKCLKYAPKLSHTPPLSLSKN